jgi:hypothetical protein
MADTVVDPERELARADREYSHACYDGDPTAAALAWERVEHWRRVLSGVER